MECTYSYTAFPCAIPEKKPGYATAALESAWKEMYERVSDRMAKLRKVAEMIGEDEDKVAWAILSAFTSLVTRELSVDKDGKLLLDTLPELAIVHKVQPLMDTVDWTPFVRFPNAVAVVNCMFITVAEWVLIRCMGFGGSESAVSVGIEKYESSSKRAMAYAKITVPNNDDGDAGKAFIFAYGHQTEPLVINHFCFLTGSVQLCCPFLFRHKKWAWMTANIDAIIQLPDGKLAVFEAKTSSTFSAGEWKDGPPAHYLRQPIQYMAVLDDPRIEMAYIGMLPSNKMDDYYCHPIPRDKKLEEDLIRHERQFFDLYVATGKLPDWSGKRDKDLHTFFAYERDKEDLKNGPVADIPASAEPLLRQWQDTKAKVKEAEDALEALKEQEALLTMQVFETLPEGASGGTFTDGDSGFMFTIGCRTVSKTLVDGKKLELLHPDVYAEVAQSKEYVYAPKIEYKAVKKPKAAKVKKGG